MVEFLTGGERVANARKKIKKLEGRSNPSAQQIANLGASRDVTRRHALKLIITGSGLGIASLVAGPLVYSEISKERKFSQPSREVLVEQDSSNGEIHDYLYPEVNVVGESYLRRVYIEALKKNRVYKVEKTLVDSTVYHGVDFFTSDKNLALQAAQSISIVEKTSCGGALCTFDTPQGVAMEMETKQDFSLKTEREKWISSISSLAHESYHGSVRKVEGTNFSEDYGILGVLNITGGKRGFWHGRGSGGLFAQQLLTTSLQLPDGSVIFPNTCEEFFAELGRARFYKKLLAPNMLRDFPESKVSYTAYPRFLQAVVNLEDETSNVSQPGLQQFLNGALNPGVVDRMHLEGDRYGLFLGVGEAIKRNNRFVIELSRPNTAALGLVALADFVEFDISNNRIISSLAKNPVTPEVILQKAREVTALKAA